MSDYYYEYEKDNFYCYPNTYVLKNKLNIKDSEKLKIAERKITALRTAELMQNPPIAEFNFDFLKQIHKALFGAIYDWAGKVRTVNISKGNAFCMCDFIESQMNEVMQKLKNENYLSNLSKEKLSERLAFYLGEINAVHPFREGNGRTQRLFIQFLAQTNGFKLDFSKITNEQMLEASVQTFTCEYKLMTELIFQAME